MRKLSAKLHNIFLIKEGEAAPLVHFWLIFMLTLGIGLAIGRASADALFLARYGIEYLPAMYVVLAPILAIISIGYAAMADHVPPERFFRLILIGLIVIVFTSWILIYSTDITYIYPAYFLIHKVASELLLVHGTLYLAHNFNTLQAKRLFPLIFAGEQLGAILGGLFVSASSTFLDTRLLPLIWALLMISGVYQLHLWHRKHGRSPHFFTTRQSGSKIKMAAKSAYQGLIFTRESPLLRNASISLFFLVIVFYILTYSTNKIFTTRFPDAQSLAGFLGLLTAATSIITLGIQIFLTNKLIDKFGIRKLNSIFPFTTAASSGLLLASFSFPIAVLVSIGKDSLLNALQNPLRSIFLNALPGYIQGRARAVSIAFVMPIALLICGAMLWGMQHLQNSTYILIPGLIAAIAFLVFSLRTNKTYTNEITTHLKSHLFIPGQDKNKFKLDLDEDALESLKNIFIKLPKARGHALTLLATHFPAQSIGFIVPRINEIPAPIIDKFLHSLFSESGQPLPYEVLAKFPMKDNHLRATLIKLLSDKQYPEAIILARQNITSESPRVRVAAIYALTKDPDYPQDELVSAWKNLAHGGISEQLSSLDLLSIIDLVKDTYRADLIPEIFNTIKTLLENENPSITARTLTLLPDTFIDKTENDMSEELRGIILSCAQKLLKQSDPGLRCSASYGLRSLHKQERHEIIFQLLNDSHESVRSKTLSILEDIEDELDYALNTGVLEGKSPPRVQSAILEVAINLELISIYKLKKIALDCANKARQYKHGISILQNNGTSSPAGNIFSIILEERSAQYIDLALQSLTPLYAPEQIAVIRASLNSGNSHHIANACEILANIQNQPAAQAILSLLQETDIRNIYKTNKFNTINDVLSWATNSYDPWVSHVARILQEDSMLDKESRDLIEHISLLKQTDIFSEVSTDDLLFVAQKVEEICYFAGDRVFDINETGRHLYIIIHGKIGLSISPDPESTDYITTLGPGSSFGEMNLLDNLPRSATAHVIEDSVLLALEKDRFIGLLKSYPELSLGILREMSLKIRETHSRNLPHTNTTSKSIG